MSWPKLSVELSGPKSPDRCQSCGKDEYSAGTLEIWREHDANDRPTDVVVVFCPRCSDRVIEKHPRLYSRLEPNEPHPGTMAICLDCRHRDGVTCPMAKFSGGPGVSITIARPGSAHIQRSPRRLSRWVRIWRTPASACDRREVAATATPTEARP